MFSLSKLNVYRGRLEAVSNESFLFINRLINYSNYQNMIVYQPCKLYK